ncbi:MAG: GNAT family N-acetyltransferase [Candidatus Magasanikbacteria bacterium]
MELTTERLKLRELRMDDAEILADLINNINITKNLAVVPHPYDKKDAEEFIEKCIEQKEEEPRSDYCFAIEEKDSSNFLGTISIGKKDKDEEVGKLGYWLAEKYWRQGYMSEALEKVLELGFDELDLRRIEAKVYTDNIASQKLLEKFDFKREGVQREAQKVEATGDIKDNIFYGLLAENFD